MARAFSTMRPLVDFRTSSARFSTNCSMVMVVPVVPAANVVVVVVVDVDDDDEATDDRAPRLLLFVVTPVAEVADVDEVLFEIDTDV